MRMPVRILRDLFCGALALSWLGCTGLVLPSNGSEPDGSNGPGPTDNGGPSGPRTPVDDPQRFAFNCTPSAGITPHAATRRLSSRQYATALEALLDAQLGTQAAPVWAAISDQLARNPADLPSTLQDYRRMSQGVDQGRIEAWYRTGEAVASAVTEDAGRLSTVTGGCSNNPNAGCVATFVQSWGRAAFRRPLEQAEVDFFVNTVFGISQPSTAGWRDLITAFLNSPDFLYIFETSTDGGMQPLSGLELASRLALHFWGAGPDEELIQVAVSGGLEDLAIYTAQVDRLATDARARPAFDEFVTDWLQLWRSPDPSASVSRPDFAAYAGADLPSPTLLADARQEVLDLVHYFTFVEPSPIEVLMTTRAGFARSPELARLYGIDSTWQPGNPPLQLPPERAGVMTRVALLLNDQATTRPILRGAAVRKRLLCDDLELPENMDDLRLAEADESQNTRDAIEALTGSGSCAACHQLLNPPGFVLETFDGLGRFRPAELVFAPDGNLVTQHQLNLNVDFLLDGVTSQVSSPQGMAGALAASYQLRACFARQYLRFTFGRSEELATDGCALEDLRQSLESGATLLDVFKGIAFSDAFRMVAKS